jgi:opacity protein-like surface antigen
MLMTPSLLVYATGGVAFQQTKAAISCPDGISVVSWCVAGPKYEEISKWNVGWTAGAGYEMAFAGNWFTRGEYRYTSVDSFDHTFFAATPIDDVSASIDPSIHRLTFSGGYRY